MHRGELLRTLSAYETVWARGSAEEQSNLARLRAFVEATERCFDRKTVAGHVTGSALVVSPDRSLVLLTLHRKLGKWLQLGGHADGNPHVQEVAMREVEEESGLAGLAFLSYEEPGLPRPLPFDLDCHLIPARPGEPEHVHYDVRYLIVADPADRLVISSESKDLRWFSVPAAAG